MKIICVGLNYKKHIDEHNQIHTIPIEKPSEPVIFVKPDTALLRNNDTFFIPDFSDEVHYECEIAVKINRVVKGIDAKFASRCYDQVALAIDFTARDVQRKSAAAGLPWEKSKAFDKSTPMPNEFTPLESFGKDIQQLNFNLDINGKTVQSGFSGNMIFTVDEIISYVSQFMTLKIGDVILTGTPVGVGKVNRGDHLEAYLEGRKMLDFYIK